MRPAGLVAAVGPASRLRRRYADAPSAASFLEGSRAKVLFAHEDIQHGQTTGRHSHARGEMVLAISPPRMPSAQSEAARSQGGK